MDMSMENQLSDDDKIKEIEKDLDSMEKENRRKDTSVILKTVLLLLAVGIIVVLVILFVFDKIGYNIASDILLQTN